MASLSYSHGIRLQAKAPAQNDKGDWASSQQPWRPPPDERFTVIDFHSTEDGGKEDRTGQAESASGYAKFAISVGEFAAHAPDSQESEHGGGNARPDINVDKIRYPKSREQTIHDERDGYGAGWGPVTWMNFADPGWEVAILGHGGGDSSGVQNGAV